MIIVLICETLKKTPDCFEVNKNKLALLSFTTNFWVEEQPPHLQITIMDSIISLASDKALQRNLQGSQIT